jgi:hypothetical protein
MSLSTLPDELLTRIAQTTREVTARDLEEYDYGTRRLDALKHFRLVCKQFAEVGLRVLFDTAILYPDEESYERCEFIDSIIDEKLNS